MKRIEEPLEEIWEPIDGFEHYQISNFGEVINTDTGYTLKPRLHQRGFYMVIVKDGIGREKSFYIHRMVAEKFMLRFDPRYTVKHKNQNKADNCILNLYQSMRKVG